MEECGTRLIEILGEFGTVIEYDLAEEEEFDLFKMTSFLSVQSGWLFW